MGVRIPPPLPEFWSAKSDFREGWKGKYGDAGGKNEQRRDSGRIRLWAAPEGYRQDRQLARVLAGNAHRDEESYVAEPAGRSFDDRGGAGNSGVLCDLFVLRGAGRGASR